MVREGPDRRPDVTNPRITPANGSSSKRLRPLVVPEQLTCADAQWVRINRRTSCAVPSLSNRPF
eukprot:scaffold733_cov267-Pinguiococcus_pyrenoidosus.AAC.22